MMGQLSNVSVRGMVCRLLFSALVALGASPAAFSQQATATSDPQGGAFIEMATLPKGRFTMGSYDRAENEQPAHTVVLSSFLMARTELTQLQYLTVMGRNPSGFKQGKLAMLHPVENVCWFDAILFCNLASQREGLEPCYYADAEFNVVWTGRSPEVFWKRSAKGYRLPTEAEWEYAAKAGAKDEDLRFPEGALPTELAWFAGNADTQDEEGFDPAWLQDNSGWTHRVATRKPNPWGLYDLSGNVREWCWDWYGLYSNRNNQDPAGPAWGQFRVLRGGGYASEEQDITVTARSQNQPGVRSIIYGFRVCRNLP